MDEADNILTLSALHEVETSALDRAKLTHMLAEAFYWTTADEGRGGYLITFDQNADYDSANFQWFVQRYPRFVYVDRIVVAAQARGRGLARAFYLDLISKARANGHDLMVCEINIEPPNPGSFAFHAAMDFAEVGSAETTPNKIVSYQALRL